VSGNNLVGGCGISPVKRFLSRLYCLASVVPGGAALFSYAPAVPVIISLILSVTYKVSLGRWALAAGMTFFFSLQLFVFAVFRIEINIQATILAWATMLALLFFNPQRHSEILKFLPFLAALTVPLAIALALLGAFEIYIFEARTNKVFFLDRLCFIFDEPSHYSIFLALSVAMLGFSCGARWVLYLLYVGLLLTWSLSGYILLMLMYCYFRGVRNISLGTISLVLLFCLGGYVFWVSYLSGVDFWLVAKINSLLEAFSGEQSKSSAFVRLQSVLMLQDFVIDSVRSDDYIMLFLGSGAGNSSSWVYEYYVRNFSWYDIVESFNFFSNMLLACGVLGFLLFIVIVFCVSGGYLRRGAFFKEAIVLLSFVSLFSGYSFGGLALLFYVQVISVAYRLRKV